MAHQKQEQQASAQGQYIQEDAGVRPYTPLQLHFLARLKQLNHLREEHENSPDPDPFLLHVVKKAIYSTLRDCESYEVQEEARAVLSGHVLGS